MSKYTIHYNDDHSSTLKCDKCGSGTCLCTDSSYNADSSTKYSCINTSTSSSDLSNSSGNSCNSDNSGTSCVSNTYDITNYSSCTNNCTSDETCTCTECCKRNSCESVSCLGSVVSASCVSSSCDNVENVAQVFTYQHGVIRPNLNRGIDGPLILGPRIKKVKPSVKLAIDGDIYVSGTVYSDDLYNNNNNNNKNTQSMHIEGIVGASYRSICPKDSNIIYVNPINGPVVIVFNNEHEQFKNNYHVTIKDISLNHKPGSSYNIYIMVSQKAHKTNFIEHYDGDCKLASSSNGIYIINSTGGAVTYRYYNNHFMIENQFIGNERIISNMGLNFDVCTIALAQGMMNV